LSDEIIEIPDAVNGSSCPDSKPSMKFAEDPTTSNAAVGPELFIPIYLLELSTVNKSVPPAFCTLKALVESAAFFISTPLLDELALLANVSKLELVV
jgi:hypothetical protein